MNKTRTSFATMRTKTQINQATQGTLPCPTHPQFNITHVCVSPQCNNNPQFCSECLFESGQQQHLARHKEQIIGWNDLMVLCRRQSVAGRLGDEPQKELNQIVLQTQAHQQNFKNYMKQQETQINQEMDILSTKFNEMISKLKQELMVPYKAYLSDLQDLGTILEKLVSDYYLEKNKDYNNDFDNFLSEVSKLQEINDQNKTKQLPQFNLRKLMQNIIPLVAKANGQFQRTLQQQTINEEMQTQVTGLTLFSSMAMKQSDNQVLGDLVNEYKTILNGRPCFKNQGLAQQTYSQVLEFIDKTYYAFLQADIINPIYKSQLGKLNKENINIKNKAVLSSPKGTRFIEIVIKDQTNKQFKQISKNEEEDEELKEYKQRQQLRHCTQLQIPDHFSQMTHTKTIKTTHKQGINCMIQLDEDFIATGSNDRTVKIFRYRVYELFKEIQFKNDVTSMAVQIRKDGTSFLLVGTFKDIYILNQAYEIVKCYDKIHTGQINCMVALEDGQTIFSCAQNDNRLVQLQNEQQKKYFEHRDGITSLIILNDSHLVSAGKDRTIKVYKFICNNTQFEKLQLTQSIQEAHQTEITALSSGGQQYILSSCASGELKVWDYQDGSPVKTVKNYSGWCFKIIYFYLENILPQATQTQTLIGSPRRRKPVDNDPFKQGYVATVSFDGTMKIFSGKALLGQENPTPMIQSQLKSVMDCHPFGSVIAVRDAITDKVEILSCGNKNDNCIQLYSLGQ